MTGLSTGLHRFWVEWRTLIIFILIMSMFRSAIADWNQVPTGSMRPTILEGDRVVVNKVAYDLRVPFTTTQISRWSDPQRGDIVTFHSPADDKLLIKRVIGIPGDEVSMRENQLIINGEAVRYQRVDPAQVPGVAMDERTVRTLLLEQHQGLLHHIMLSRTRAGSAHSFQPVVVPADHYLMLGDNRDNSQDSRYIGFIKRDAITGRAHTVAFSVNYERYYLPRTERFLHPLQVDQP